MAVATTKAEADQQNSDVVRQIKIVNMALLALVVVLIAVPAVGGWWVSRQLPVVSTVTVDNLRVIGASALCPGDPLTVEYDLHAKGAGILVRDWTSWLVTPPKTMIFSTSRRFILDGPIDQHLRETWHVPSLYLNYETEVYEPLPVGDYRRYLAISSPSRSTVIAIANVPYSIRGDCYE